ncbi:MAG: hypothetical protein BWX64_02359 [Acidobacteria bacterium ADurb.Bin051]|nr:MAG: hypothetical protein BWX64_02359 [Acidobacteria bacterium ADurb.Bin051]
MVVRVAGGVLAAGVPEQLERPVGDHLVGVHVRRGARPALHHVDDEVAVPVAVDDLLAGAVDRVGDRRREMPEAEVRPGRRLLDRGERPHQRREVGERHAGEREVLHPAQRLDPVEGVGGDLAVAEQVVLVAGRPARVRLGEADRPGGAETEVTGDEPRHRTEHRHRRCAVFGERREHPVAGEREDIEASDGPGGGAVGRHLEEGALPRRLAGAEEDQPLFPARPPPGEGEPALDHHVAGLARLPFPEQLGAGGIRLRFGARGEQGEGPLVETAENLTRSQQFDRFAHGAILSRMRRREPPRKGGPAGRRHPAQARRKQERRWSSTTPTACIQA